MVVLAASSIVLTACTGLDFNGGSKSLGFASSFPLQDQSGRNRHFYRCKRLIGNCQQHSCQFATLKVLKAKFVEAELDSDVFTCKAKASFLSGLDLCLVIFDNCFEVGLRSKTGSSQMNSAKKQLCMVIKIDLH